MLVRYGLLLVVVLLSACENPAKLHYQPAAQPKGAKLYADYQLLQDQVAVLIDTDGRRLEDAYISRSDGTVVRPISVGYVPYGQSMSIGPGIGVGPVGVGIGVPVGPKTAQGLTTAIFDQEAIGSPPWALTFKVESVEPVAVTLDGGNTISQ